MENGWVRFETKDEKIVRMEREIHRLHSLVTENREAIKKIATWAETEVNKAITVFNNHKHKVVYPGIHAW